MISVLIKSAEKFGIDEEIVREKVLQILKKNRVGKAEVSVAFVGSEEIRKLNKKYRSLNKPTSVLSFSQLKGRAFYFVPDKVVRLGDVVICPEIAKNRDLEIGFLLEHGIKNLLSEISTAKNRRA